LIGKPENQILRRILTCDLNLCGYEGEVAKMLKRILTPDEVMSASERALVEELSASLESSHEGDRALVINLEYNVLVLSVGLIRIVSGVSRQEIAREDVLLSVIADLMGLYSVVVLLNKRTNSGISAASSTGRGVYVTEVMSGKSVLSKLVDKAVFVEDSRKIHLLNLVYPLRVPDIYQIIGGIATKVAVVVVVTRNVFKIN
jgi:hypothetical protein